MVVSSLTETIARQALKAKAASRTLSELSAEQKTQALEAMAAGIESELSDILFHNEIDVQAAREAGLNSALIERLVLSAASIKAMAQGVREIGQQKDPLGEVLETWARPNGIRIEKIRVPL